MRFRNTTNVPEALLREVIRFVCPSNVTNFSIWFKRRPHVNFCGTAYLNRRHIVCRIPQYQRLKSPYKGAGGYTTGKGYRVWCAMTYEEALVGLVAHEFRHLSQHANPRLYRRTWGARGQYSEVDCDAYANRMIRAWRAAKGGCVTNAPVLVPRDPSKPKPLTPRQRLEALAAPHGITVYYNDPAQGVHSVYPPDGMFEDEEKDPFYGEHCHDGYQQTKEAIETYARLVLNKAQETDRVVA